MADLKKMDIAALTKEVASKREALRQFRFGEAGARSRNVKGGQALRKEIAQLLTELNARKIASAPKKG